MAEYNGKQGVWRTVGGRRIFIADGEDLQTAMKNSGKFNTKGLTEEGKRLVRGEFKNQEEKEMWERVEKETEDLINLSNENAKKFQISEREIKNLKTQKSLKALADEGKAKDITTYGDDESRKLQKKHGRLEVVQVTHGTYGMNGALLRSYETGEYFVITSRNSNLFYWV